MTSFPPDRPPTASLGCGSLVLRLLAPLLLACTWLAAPPCARADGCEGCPAPTLADLKQVEGFKLQNRYRGLGQFTRDHYILDRGACEATLEGIPEITIEDAWLVLRATGEVWNCPHSKSADTITVESSASDRTDWSFSVKLSAGFEALGASLKTEVQAGRTTGTTVTEVTRISKTLTPTFCHRILWRAYFQVARVKAVGAYSLRQHWAWWTKNESTGSTQVHASGDIYMDCGGGELELTRNAPISGHFELSQRGCDGPECQYVVPKQLGMFPPWTGPDAPDDGAGGAPTTESPTTESPTTESPTTESPTTESPTTESPTVEDDEPVPPEDGLPEALPSSEDLGDAPTGALPDPLESAP